MAIPFVHTADVHLARLQAGGLSGNQLAERRLDALRALHECLAYVRSSETPLLFIAGDLFEHATAAKPLVLEVRDALAGLGHTRVFVAAGNHDYAAPDSFYRTLSWPGNVHLFLDDWEHVSVDELGVTVHGRGFGGPECDVPHLRQYRVRDRDDDGLHVVVLHGDYAAAMANSLYLPISNADVKSCAADYVALGHLHRPQVLLESKGLALAAYSGALEPLNFSEDGPHGFFAGQLVRGGASLRFVPAAIREYHQVCVDASGLDTMPKIVDAARESLSGLPKKDMVRLTLRGELQPGLEAGWVRLHELGEEFFAFMVVNEAHPAYDLQSLREGYSARAAFVRRLMDRLVAGNEEEQALARQALQMGLDALAGREVRVS